MNILLKIALVNESLFGNTTIAHTAVICKTTETAGILQRFFNCFNMPEPSPFGVQFHVDVVTAPVYDFDDPATLQLADDLNEDNPFLLDECDNTWIWHNVNEHLYA